MGEKTNTDLGLGARAWDTAKTYNSSNILKHFDGIIHTESIETLGNFTKKRGIETRGIDSDAKVDDRLLKYTLKRITPTRNLEEVENPQEMYLITDEHGRDIGTYEITEHGPVFRLSPKIQEYNEKIIATFPEEQQEILRARYKTENLEELTAKLAKGESIALASKEQARDDVEKEYEKRGLSQPDGISNQDPEEEKEINEIPSDMRGQVLEQCKEKGISIKAVLVVDCPDCLTEEIDNDKVGIKKGAGPVILIQARSGDASLADDVYAFQNGVEIPNANAEKEKLVTMMEQQKGKPAVAELVDEKKRELEDAIAERIEVEAYKIEQLEGADFASEEDRQTAIAKVRSETAGEIKSLVDYYDYEHDKEMQEVVKKVETNDSSDTDDSMDDFGGKNRWELPDPYNHN